MILAVMLGAGLGAAARYRIDRSMSRRWPGPFPLGTFTINMLGSFALGIVMGAQPGAGLVALLGTGLCGGFTTFSTFSYETVRLFEEGWRRVPVFYVAASLVVGLSVAGLGLLVSGLF